MVELVARLEGVFCSGERKKWKIDWMEDSTGCVVVVNDKSGK